jgi:hypothetical protein
MPAASRFDLNAARSADRDRETARCAGSDEELHNVGAHPDCIVDGLLHTSGTVGAEQHASNLTVCPSASAWLQASPHRNVRTALFNWLFAATRAGVPTPSRTPTRTARWRRRHSRSGLTALARARLGRRRHLQLVLQDCARSPVAWSGGQSLRGRGDPLPCRTRVSRRGTTSFAARSSPEREARRCRARSLRRTADLQLRIAHGGCVGRHRT